MKYFRSFGEASCAAVVGLVYLGGALAGGCSDGSGASPNSGGTQNSGASGSQSAAGSSGANAFSGNGSGATGAATGGAGGATTGASIGGVSTGAAAGAATGGASTGATGDNGGSGTGAPSDEGGSAAGSSDDASTGPGNGSTDASSPPPPPAEGGPPPAGGTNSGAGPWGTPVAGGPTASGTMVTAAVTVNRTAVVGHIGPGYAGFSVEKRHITNSSFTGSNAPLIALYKLIGPTNLRIGANDVDMCTWAPTTPPGGGAPPYGYDVGTAMVDQFAAFVKASGAQVIYGVNFHSHNASNTAAEAKYVQPALGSNLMGFELGNEIDKYDSWANQQTEWESIASAILASAPSALLIGPASTGGASSSLTAPFAKSESAKFGNKLALLTQHYYVASATSAGATVSSLQQLKSDVAQIATTVDNAAKSYHVPDGFRFGEANTFSHHGAPGISDTLIAALWGIDFMFVLAENGSSGVNFHGGETGMDGTNPFYYEPIMESNGAVVQVQPMYYGMLFTYLAGQGNVLSTSVNSGNANFTAHAVDYQADGSVSVVLDNKNATAGVQATINLGSPTKTASAIFLRGSPAGTLTAAASGVTLADAAVTPTGQWKRGMPYIQATSGNTVTVFVPPVSAALVRVQ